MDSLNFGRFRIERDDDPDDEFPYALYDENNVELDAWMTVDDALLDIDNSPTGEEITLEQWQALWDWAEKQ